MNDFHALIDGLRRLGAAVATTTPSTPAAIAAAEKSLGFALPGEYAEFVRDVGGITIELERTWFFYGLDMAMRKTREYDEVFGEVRAKSDGPYYPKRFLVLADEGDYSNEASGTVYDADLDAMLVTAGRRWVDKEDAFTSGYWGWLLDELEAIRERVADADDVLVAGGARDLAKAKRSGDAVPQTAELIAAAAKRHEAVNRLYDVCAPYAPSAFQCFFDGCSDCATSNEVFARKSLRELGALDLAHYAYWGLVHSSRLPKTPSARQHVYKHYLPRILELIDDIGATGNPKVVIPSILAGVHAPGVLTPGEGAAIEQWAMKHWAWTLEHPGTTLDHASALLHAWAKTHPSLSAYLSTWHTLSREGSPAHRLRTGYAERFNFEKGPDFYGWQGMAAQHDELKHWLSRR